MQVCRFCLYMAEMYNGHVAFCPCALVSYDECAKGKEKKAQTDGRQTVTLRFPL